MARYTSYDEIYDTLITIIGDSTGRPVWRFYGSQTHSKTPHAIIKIHNVVGLNNPQKTRYELAAPGPNNETIIDVNWNESTFDLEVDFISSKTGDSYFDAATRFRAALYDHNRVFDLFEIVALNGRVSIKDLSFVSSENIIQRCKLNIRMSANIADPLPIDAIGFGDIVSQNLALVHVRQDGVETQIAIPIQKQS